jgi:hypothetical protein
LSWWYFKKGTGKYEKRYNGLCPQKCNTEIFMHLFLVPFISKKEQAKMKKDLTGCAP